MRRTFSFILLLVTMTCAAQVTSYDRLTFGEKDLMGTSRYVGMAGAMAAVGGDASAAADNPAGLGVYRRSELMLTFDHQINIPSQGRLTQQFSVAQASWNFYFPLDRMRGVVGNNVMLNYRRVKNFRREYGMRLNNMAASQTDVMALKTQGLGENALTRADAWDDSEIGWLSKIGYDGYLIDPDSADNTLWDPHNPGNVNGTLDVRESGSVDEFSFTWGMNISNQWYVGAELGLRSLTYSKSTYYSEVFDNGNRYNLDSYVSASGVGMLGKIGLLYRPISLIRIGAAFHAPVPMAFSIRNYADLSSYNETIQSVVHTPEMNNSPEWISQPLRAVFGLAFQIGKQGLVSMEYDYEHDLDKRVLDTHWAKLGLEYVLANNWFFNLGYGFRLRQINDKGQLSDPVNTLDYNSVRLDTEAAQLHYANHITAGVSYRFKYAVAGLAYQCRLSEDLVRFHELQPDPIRMNTTSHKIVLSLAWRH